MQRTTSLHMAFRRFHVDIYTFPVGRRHSDMRDDEGGRTLCAEAYAALSQGTFVIGTWFVYYIAQSLSPAISPKEISILHGSL